MTLDQLEPGEWATVEEVTGEPAVVQRLLELGLMEGDDVEVVARAPFGDPIEIRSGPNRLSLRLREAAGVRVTNRRSR